LKLKGRSPHRFKIAAAEAKLQLNQSQLVVSEVALNEEEDGTSRGGVGNLSSSRNANQK
jgi:hypothetical protein